MDFHDKTGLVTGASSGIGEQFALQLASHGANLILVARTAEKLRVLSEKIRSTHPDARVDVIVADLADAGSGEAIADAVSRLGIHVDVLINNAGVGSHDAFIDEDPGALAAQIQLNVSSVVDLSVRFLPAMIAARSGAVVNVASTAAFQPIPTMAVYGATKAFVLSFTEALWGETRTSGVRVMTLCPGATDTNFFANTGKDFLTRGRQSPDQVVHTALHALDGRSPTVVSGQLNRLTSTAYRLLPRAMLIRISKQLVKTSRR